MNAADDLMSLARVALSLIVVVGLVVLAARLARRAGVRGAGAGLRVVDRTGLSRDASVAVVQVGGRALVLGVTSHQVSVLSELDLAELEAAEAAEFEAAEGDPVDSPVNPAVDGAPAAGAAPAVRQMLGSRGFGAQRGAARPGGGQASGSVLSPATWRQGVQALRDLTVRRG